MKKIDSNLNCPACQGPLTPRVLGCDQCSIRVEGSFAFASNEFSILSPDMLHFLRIFVHCEGRIKDMEKALGVSYPTVKAMMGQLKTALVEPAPRPTAPESDAALSLLDAMNRGELTYEEALRRIKQERDKR